MKNTRISTKKHKKSVKRSRLARKSRTRRTGKKLIIQNKSKKT